VISVYFALAPVGYAVFTLWGALPTRDPARRTRLLQATLNTAFRSMHSLLRGLRILHFDPRATAGCIPDGPCLLVANHPTLTDISALLATVHPLAFPVKPDLFRRFWVKLLLSRAGAFEGPGTNPFSVDRFIRAGVDRASRGDRVLVFPEGTRSPEHGLGPFGRAPFEIAVQADVPVVPIVITCEPRWLTKQSGFLDPPEAVPVLRLRVLPAIEPGDAGSSSRTLRDIVLQRIRAETE